MRFLLIICLLQLGIIFGTCSNQHTIIHGRILNSLIKEISSEYDVEVYSKGGSFIRNLKEFNLSFRYRYPIDNFSAQKMYYEIYEKIAKRYNQDLSIRPYLDIYPFNSRIEVGLWFSANRDTNQILSIRRYTKSLLYQISNGDGTETDYRCSYEDLKNYVLSNEN